MSSSRPVGTASAECAWVMWGQSQDARGVRYAPINSDTTKDDCERRADHLRQRMEEKAGRLPMTDKFICFPGAIDPRRPTGKGGDVAVREWR